MSRPKLHTMVKRMSSKIVNGVQDGMDSAWVENWIEVLLRDSGVDLGDISSEKIRNEAIRLANDIFTSIKKESSKSANVMTLKPCEVCGGLTMSYRRTCAKCFIARKDIKK